MVGTVTARVSVLPAVGSELPTDSDEAAVVCTALLDEAVDDALDMVGLHVGQSCFRTDSEDALPGLLEERSVRNCLVRPDTVLLNQDFVSTDNRGDDRFSPGVRNHFSLDWQVDLDSHWMVYGEGRWNGENGYRAGASDWRSVLCCVALMPRLPEFPDTECLNCFNELGKTCVMDLSAWGPCPQIGPPDCGLGTFAQPSPNRQKCLVSEVSSDAIAQVRGCAWMRGCVGNRHSPGETPDERKVGVSPGEIECTEDSGYIRLETVVESPVYVWSVTGSLLFGSPFRRVLGLPQPTLPSRGLTWIILADFWFSCRLVWGRTMIDLPAVNQAGAATTATNPLPGTFLGLGLDLSSESGYSESDVSSRQLLYQASDT